MYFLFCINSSHVIRVDVSFYPQIHFFSINFNFTCVSVTPDILLNVELNAQKTSYYILNSKVTELEQNKLDALKRFGTG